MTLDDAPPGTVPATARRTVELHVGGQWQPPTSGQYVSAHSPATGADIGSIAQASVKDADTAIQAAQHAFTVWGALGVFDRAATLRRIGHSCQRRRDELAYALTLDQGKPLHCEAFQEVDDMIGYWLDAAEDIVRFDGAIAPSRLAGARALVERRPLGVVSLITPWNWPYTMPIQVMAPALAAGNTVVWVPAPSTSWCSAVLMDCILEADLPAGVVSFLPGEGPVAGDACAGHPAVAAVAFVGSTTTGLHVSRRAAGKHQLIEMGNNGPLVVMNDADLDRAVDGAVLGSFLCSGQSCAAAERILVHHDIHDDFVAALTEKVSAQVKLGDPFARDTTMGPLNNAGVATKMAQHVNDAATLGAQIVVGGRADDNRPTDLYWQPTILDNVPREALVAREETFGPIAPIISITSLTDAITLTNALPYGLIAAIYTRDAGSGLRYADAVKAGWVNINESTNHFETHLPFGGGASTLSGVGKVGGRYALEALTQPKTVILNGI
jgi:succinate-semialdehyde dehydrogenase/glutarate-semialdehyde dehydrogenase